MTREISPQTIQLKLRSFVISSQISESKSLNLGLDLRLKMRANELERYLLVNLSSTMTRFNSGQSNSINEGDHLSFILVKHVLLNFFE